MSGVWALFALVSGFLLGRVWERQGRAQQRKGTRARERPVPSEEAQKAVAVHNRQMKNLWDYDGEIQTKIDPNLILQQEERPYGN